MLAALERTFADERPDWVLVYGDTNSTLAAALAAVKMHLPVAHLEAGLRSFNRAMPEEHNRVLTDHAADLLLAPTDVAVGHLTNEGLASRTVMVGDVMTDVLLNVRASAGNGLPEELSQENVEAGEFYLATIHRAENTDDPERLRSVIRSLGSLDRPVVLLAHPRLVAKVKDAGVSLDHGSLRARQPLPYPQLVAAAANARGVDHGLGRAPEGGLPAPRPLHHHPPGDRVDRDGRSGMERPGGAR
ncbi:UDP-N-acetyl glucosamine 2-epimerase [Georgenia sp. SUBG003]|uniref:UDP-N-acetyl glucosamine 2-epimerase n=1 Tax=Georgenia sp. SUBG003 TaxID=1497974 RepID=UPI003AB2060B